MKILANDGISKNGKSLLEKNGFEVLTIRIAQPQLINYILAENINVLLVRNITKITTDIIEQCPSLQLVASSKIPDEIVLNTAKGHNLPIVSTKHASSRAVAELVFAHLLGMVRFLHDSNRQMPLEGDSKFKELNSYYAKGTEVQGKTLGIVGSGAVGKEVAKIALGLGMNVLFTNKSLKPVSVQLSFFNKEELDFNFTPVPLSELLEQSDFVSLHTSALSRHLIGSAELKLMKKGTGIINTACGGILDEIALIKAIEEKHIAYAALDVFETEPNPEIQLLMNPELSLSPHTGGSTLEALERTGIELAEIVINHFK